MAESRSQQLDWFRFEDILHDADDLLSKRAQDLGVKELAYRLNVKPGTIHNQLAHEDEKKPSFELALLVAKADQQFEPVWQRDRIDHCGARGDRALRLAPRARHRAADLRPGLGSGHT